ncbi:MAG: hypothetical protein U0790_17310 [Isosphaeraceae bacterium]
MRAASIREIFPSWLAAVPVVVPGGPLGSLVSRYVPRRSLLSFVACLCLAQYVLTCYHEHVSGLSQVYVGLGAFGLNLALHSLFAFGQRSLPLEG